MTEAVEEAMKLQSSFPDTLAGFDLVRRSRCSQRSRRRETLTLRSCAQVGREDSGRPLWYFREALSLPAERGVELPFFFHAGETGELIGPGC